ncbi:RNA helicase [Ranunculus cassubicifolius]
MAAKSSTQLQRPKKSKKKHSKIDEIDRFDSLKWSSSLPTDNDSEDPFSSELLGAEGGFLSLEEIEECDYKLLFPEGQKELNGTKSEGSGEGLEEKKVKKKKKAKTKKKNKEIVAVSDEGDSCISSIEEVPTNSNDEEVKDDSEVDESEFYAWNELRLHPLLTKSIHKLGFKEPTPIQRACIPAAAHQGKDVIGAAETGSGKTLAFGLPILQRLLEEREKDAKSLSEKAKTDEDDVQENPLRALIVTPTRELALQVADHLKKAAKFTNIRVVPIVGGMSTEKQERLLNYRPEIIVATPGRLWELMSGGHEHLVELHSLSFFVLDEADRMIENGHFHELQSIIDMLPVVGGLVEGNTKLIQKKRQTFVFSATIALSADFRKKLKRGSVKSKHSMDDGGMSSLEALSARAGMRADASIIDLTNASIVADKLEESFVECREEDKDGYLYYLLSVHGSGRTIVFCTSIAALRHISSILRILGVNIWTLHAQMQQRARLKAIDRFRANEHAVLIATDVAARGLDIPGVRTVVHYQLPHSAEVYVHRSGRTARASSDGCCIALISPTDGSKFTSLCKSFSKESLQRFPLDNSLMPEIMKRLSLARQIDKISRKDSQVKAQKTWQQRNAEAMELDIDEDDSEEEQVNSHKRKKRSDLQLQKLQQELNSLLSRPLQSKTFSHRYLAGSGVSPLMQHQFQELARERAGDHKRSKLVVIGQNCIEPLEALRNAGDEVQVRLDVKDNGNNKRSKVDLRRKRKQEKTRLRDNRRNAKKALKEANE